MQITRTHNGYHLGDNLVHLHFLRKVALANPDRQFVHAAQWQYIRQLKDVIADVPNIKLEEFGYLLPSDSIDAWRGANNFWYQSEIRNDFVRFHLEQWFPHLADRMGVDNPVTTAKDMLFDYPKLLEPIRGLPFMFGDPNSFEVLLINSPPGSNQFQSYNFNALDALRGKLTAGGNRVIPTWPISEDEIGEPDGFRTVTEIGQLSLRCHTILMVSTGPSWPTFNVWNQDTVMHRIILLEPERVNLAPNTTHCATIDEAAEVLKSTGLL